MDDQSLMKVFNKIGSSAFKVNEVRSPDEIAELTIWNKLKDTELMQFNAAISRVKFSPVAPYSVVSLSGLSAPFVHGKTRTHKFSFAKTKTPFSSVAFRKDGVLIALGREDSTIDTYPVNDHQSLHRRWKVDSGVIFGLAFSPFSNHIFAGCGNGSIKIIDIATRAVESLDGAHDDAVTSIVPLDSGNMWVTGGNDGIIKVWDMNERVVITEIPAGNPVSHLVLKGSRVFAAAGESVVVVDVQPRASLVHSFVAHSRSIVGMAISRSNLVTASSDRTIRVFDPTTFTILHTMKLHSDITAFDVLPDASAIAIGLAGGVLQMKYAVNEEEAPTMRTAAMPADFRVFKKEPEQKRTPWNKFIKEFCFKEALDAALEEEDPEVIVGLLDELDRLGRLEVAVSERGVDDLVPLLRFLVNHSANYVWSHVCLKVVIAIEKIYRRVITDEPTVGKLFEDLVKVIEDEMKTQRKAARLVGQIDILLS